MAVSWAVHTSLVVGLALVLLSTLVFWLLKLGILWRASSSRRWTCIIPLRCTLVHASTASVTTTSVAAAAAAAATPVMMLFHGNEIG